MSLLLTLILTPANVLFVGLFSNGPGYPCSGIRAASLVCLTGLDDIWIFYVVSIAVLSAVVLGIFPRITSIPFAYIAFSVVSAAALADGGDQVILVLAILFVPYSFCDRRISMWRFHGASAQNSRQALVATAVSQVIRIQISIVYLVSGLSKLGTDAWVDGSAIYYWVRHPIFGSPEWLRPIVYPVTGTIVGSAVVTWGTLLLECTLGISMLLGANKRLKFLLPVGLVFHFAIAIVMGITSFSIAMAGALVLLLVPHDFAWRDFRSFWFIRPWGTGFCWLKTKTERFEVSPKNVC